MRIILTLWLTTSLEAIAFAAGPIADERICAQHPVPSDKNAIKSARVNRTGIRAQRLADLQQALEQAKREGKPLADFAEVGGGDCQDKGTPLGDAAAAVGALLYDSKLHCSAVLVAPNMVVTAAHCVKGFDLNKLEFLLGPDTSSPIQRAFAYHADWYEKYDPNHLGVNDLGYVYLRNQITEAPPVTLMVQPQVKKGPTLYVGYGIAGALPGARRCVTIPVYDTCGDTFSSSTENMNTCNGDSGGGVFSGTSLAGVTSWGDEPCELFGVSADVGFYSEWIKLRISEAPRVRPARIEESARGPYVSVSADALLTGPDPEPEFDSKYKGRWVKWKVTLTEVKPAGRDEHSGICTVVGKEGQATLVLQDFPGGCDLKKGELLRFKGRLASLHIGNVIRIAFPELSGSVCPAMDTQGLDGDLLAGLDFYSRNKFDEAIIRLEAAVSKSGLGPSDKVCGYVRLAQSHEQLAQKETRETIEAIRGALRIDPDIPPPNGLEALFAKVKTEFGVAEKQPRRLQIEAAASIALKRIRARDGSLQPFFAPTAFIGVQPSPNRVPHLSIGVVAGAGIASDTPTGFVVGAAARLRVWNRWGLLAGHGFRFASNDRVRHAWGVGVTVRLWSFQSSPQ